MKIYISGAITNVPDYVDKFNHAQNVLTVKYPNATIINPVLIVKPDFADWIDCMKADIKELVDCNTIYMMKGWQRSKGAMLEFIIAKYLDMTILFEDLKDE